jgi:hypothetical protein
MGEEWRERDTPKYPAGSLLHLFFRIFSGFHISHLLFVTGDLYRESTGLYCRPTLRSFVAIQGIREEWLLQDDTLWATIDSYALYGLASPPSQLDTGESRYGREGGSL